jgi:hypothetical protein
MKPCSASRVTDPWGPRFYQAEDKAMVEKSLRTLFVVVVLGSMPSAVQAQPKWKPESRAEAEARALREAEAQAKWNCIGSARTGTWPSSE